MLLGNIAGMDMGLVLIIAVVVMIGGSQLPRLARNIGGASREFRKAQREAEEEAAAAERRETEGVVPAPLPLAAAPVPTQVTINRSDLERLLNEDRG